MAEPKIILFDIETSHNIVASFRLSNDDYIPHTNIIQERYVICAAWKELHKPTIHAVSTLDDPRRYKRTPHDDYHVIKTLRDVLSEADVIVAHNGDQYDIKFLNARALAHGFQPLPPIQSIDTYKVAKQQFLLNSNRLDYLGAFLGLGRKIKTDVELWLGVLRGEPEAVRKMVTYNKQDVVLLEKVFLKLQPYIPNHVNRQLYGGSGCPRCDSLKVQARGFHKTITQIYQRWHCQTCGGWYRSKRPEKNNVQVRLL